MLGKLLKYEFRATGRTFLPFLGALLLVSGISRLFGEISARGQNESMTTEILYVVGIVISSLLIMAVLVVTFMLMIQRFRKNLLGDEGYLMLTLPVSHDSLIFGKLIVSVVWMIASALVVAAAVAIMAMVDFKEIWNGIKYIFELIIDVDIANGLTIALIIIAVILALMQTVLTFYMSLSLSMLANHRRGLATVGFYILYMIAAQIVSTIGIRILRTIDLGDLLRDMTATTASNLFLLGLIIVALVSSAIVYVITRFMLKRKLNLE